MAPFNRTQNSTRTFLFGIISKIIMIVCPFITRTLVIYKLGAEYLGLSSLFSSVLSILSISELGLSSATVFCLYKPVAEDDKKTICALLSFLKKAYLAVGIAILFLGIVIMPFLKVFTNSDYPKDINIYFLFALYLLNSSFSYLAFAYKRSLFIAYQREDIIHKIEAASEIVKVFLQLVVLAVFSNYYLYVAVLPISTILCTTSIEYVSRKRFASLVPKGSLNGELKGVMKKKIVYLSTHSVASTLINTVDNIVISMFLGLVPLAVYGNYHYISSSVFSFILISFNSLKPAVANEINVDSKKKVLKTYNTLQFMCWWLTMWCSICLYCLYQPFIKLWLGKEYLLSSPAMVAIVFYFYTNAVRQFFTSIYIDACGLWNKILLRQIIAAAINLILDVLLVKRYGITGIVFASFITCLLVSLPMDIYVTYKYVFHERYGGGIFKIIWEYFLLIVIGFVTYFCCSFIRFESILGLIAKAIVCVFVPNTIMVVLYYKTDKFKDITSHVTELLKKEGRKAQ